MKRIVWFLAVACWVTGAGGAYAQEKILPEAGDMDRPTFVPTVKVGKVLEGGCSNQNLELNNV